MKKLMVMIAVAVFALALAGCSSNLVMSTDDDESVASDNDAAVEEADGSGTGSDDGEPEENVIIGENAWSDSDDAADAAEGAGFTDGFVLPDPLPVGDYAWSEPTFNSMDNVVEAHYNGDVVGLTVRKGEGIPVEELSSDTSDYGHDWTQDCNGIEVACHGYEDGVANFIEWENEGSSYDIWCVGTKEDNIGMSPEEVTAMVAGVK